MLMKQGGLWSWKWEKEYIPSDGFTLRVNYQGSQSVENVVRREVWIG